MTMILNLKNFILTTAILASTQFAHAQDRPEFPLVPRDHWSYAAAEKAHVIGTALGGANFTKHIPPSERGNRATNRYELAVFVARVHDAFTLLGPLTPSPDSEQNRLKLFDLLEALRREYRDELARIQGRSSKDTGLYFDYIKEEDRVQPPPRLTFSPEYLKHVPPPAEEKPVQQDNPATNPAIP